MRLASTIKRLSFVHWLCLFLGFVILSTLAIKYALPVRDGDLFWQMAYGRYLLEHKTLIPDHTIYSWTPTTSGHIYCAWIGEIVLYLIYQTAGLPLLFAFRYLCLLIVLVVLCLYALKLKLLKEPFVYLVALMVVIASNSGTYIKPEIFSLVLMSLMSGTYFYLKAGFKNLFDFGFLKGREHVLFYNFPVIMLIWVNSHGGFIFGLFFVGIIVFGELLNYFFSSSEALSKKALKHLMIAACLTFLVTFLTPYFYSYHLNLLHELLNPERQTAFMTIEAYQSVFKGNPLFHYVEVLVLASVLLVSFFVIHFFQNRKVDLAIIILNLAFGIVFTNYLRATYFWPIIFSLSLLYLFRQVSFSIAKPVLRLIARGAIAVFIFFSSALVIYEARCNPISSTYYLGFGTGPQNPEIEAAFIKRFIPGTNLCNDYNTGGYLLWGLYPDYKVMIDPRSFPYQGWYSEYREWAKGKNFESFLKKYPSDVALLRITEEVLFSKFFSHPDWRLAFFGPTAGVFVRKEILLPPGAENFAKDRFKEVKNPSQLFLLFVRSINFELYEIAGQVLDTYKKRYGFWPAQKKKIAALERFRDGVFAYHKAVKTGKEVFYDKAMAAFEECNRSKIIQDSYGLPRIYRHKSLNAFKEKRYFHAYRYEMKILKIKPDNVTAIYNAGIAGYLYEKISGDKRQPKVPGKMFGFERNLKTNWRSYLSTSLQNIPNTSPFSEQARKLIEGKEVSSLKVISRL